MHVDRDSGRGGAAELAQSMLFDAIPAGCLLLDGDGVIQGANRAGLALLGVRCDELVGTCLAQWVARRMRPRLERHLSAVRSRKEPETCDLELAPREGVAAHWLRLRTDIVPASRHLAESLLCVAVEVDDLLDRAPEVPAASAGEPAWDPAYGVLPGQGEPLAAAVEAPSSVTHTRVPVRRESAAASCGRVLVVDDEQLILSSTVRLLRRIGYDPVSCLEPGEALRRFSDDPEGYDAVVTDYQMPGMTGLELSTRLRAVRPGVPILMVSGSLGTLDPLSIESAGVRHVLSKPLDVSAFMTSLCQITRRV